MELGQYTPVYVCACRWLSNGVRRTHSLLLHGAMETTLIGQAVEEGIERTLVRGLLESWPCHLLTV